MQDNLNDQILATSEQIGLDSVFVEKDYHVTCVIH